MRDRGGEGEIIIRENWTKLDVRGGFSISKYKTNAVSFAQPVGGVKVKKNIYAKNGIKSLFNGN